MVLSCPEKSANSTFWFEDNPKNGLHMLYGSLQKITQQKSAHSRDWWGNPGSPRGVAGSGGNEQGFRDPPLFTSEDATGGSLSDGYQWKIAAGSGESDMDHK
jgi:hypothetical protein